MNRLSMLCICLLVAATALFTGCSEKKSEPAAAAGAATITADNAEAELDRLEKEIQADQ